VEWCTRCGAECDEAGADGALTEMASCVEEDDFDDLLDDLLDEDELFELFEPLLSELDLPKRASA
jgi:Fe-S-cluster containining protein